ncbi:unnamed protein product [Rhizoctonia solani]|uniref:Protein kinase domain-containing protein n=1 Tax=Rhizoctonia solani TaxID=456999 RepID=A0A8H3GXA7_9AGAM|nr:unnamed protein product [Rhizoctonia solani]
MILSEIQAPEVLKEKGTAPTTESDVYAFGMTIFNIMTGQPPFADKWEPLVIVEVLKMKGQPSQPEFNHTLQRSDAKAKMSELLKWCIAYEPGDRPNVSQVKDALIEVEKLECTLIEDVKIERDGSK